MPMLPMNPDQVRRLQRILAAQDLYRGRPSGQMDGRTIRAIRQFQRRNGLPPTGQYDTATDQFLADSFRQLTVNSRPIRGLSDRNRRFIEENYGYMLVYLRHPEIGPILIEAAEKGWDEARLQGKLQRTDWWRETSATARQWQRDIYENPADVAERRQRQEASIRDQAMRLGVSLRPKRLSAIVEDSLRNGWSQDLIVDALMAEVRYRRDGQPMGQVATDIKSIQDLRYRYMVALSDKQAFRWAKQIASGELTVQDVEARLAQRAQNTYGHLGDQLQGGMATRDLFDAHIGAIADELELDPDSVDLTDRRWADVLSFVDDKGRTRAMTVGEARRLARSQPGWQRTERARSEAADLALNLAQSFGRM